MKKKSRHLSSGFGLLEALVALVLFAGVGVVIIAWLQQSLSTTVRVQSSLNESIVRGTMLDFITAVNLYDRPSGEERVGDHIFQWKTETVVPEEAQMGYPMGVGRYGVKLVQVQLTAKTLEGSQPVIAQSVTLLAHRALVTQTAEPKLFGN